MNRPLLLLFDIDGVLLDSLTPHLKICEDKNEEYGLGLKIPDAKQFKALVRRGVRISPMKYFFLAVGFPEESAEKANDQYQRVFMQKYKPAPFPHVGETLEILANAGLTMGIVTSNVRKNVVDALGPKSMRFFHPGCIFSKDDTVGHSKAEAIGAAIKTIQVGPFETIYVGDQPADLEAARSAGVNFVGVTYGWGISDDDSGFPLIRDIRELPAKVLGRMPTAARVV